MPKQSYFKAAFCTIIDVKTHNGSKVTNEFINDVVILISAEEHLELACELWSLNKQERDKGLGVVHKEIRIPEGRGVRPVRTFFRQRGGGVL